MLNTLQNCLPEVFSLTNPYRTWLTLSSIENHSNLGSTLELLKLQLRMIVWIEMLMSLLHRRHV